MIKTRIHIKTTNEFMDDSLFILTELPFVPRVGDRIQLSQDMLNELEQKVRSDLDLAKKYINVWTIFDVKYVEKNPGMLRDIDFEFDLAKYVSHVCIVAGSDIVDIKLKCETSIFDVI